MKAKFGWFVIVLVMGFSLVGCPPIEEIPDLPVPSEPEVAPQSDTSSEYRVEATLISEDGRFAEDGGEIDQFDFFSSCRGDVWLNFISTDQIEFISISVQYEMVDGDYRYVDILGEYWSRGKDALEEWYAQVEVPFSREVMSADVSVQFRYSNNEEQRHGFYCTILNPDDQDQDRLEDAWEAGFDCFDNQDFVPEGDVLYGEWGDPDNDGLLNTDERRYKTSPCKFDTDGDGFSDSDEVWGWRTNPNDIDSHPPIYSEEGEPGKG